MLRILFFPCLLLNTFFSVLFTMPKNEKKGGPAKGKTSDKDAGGGKAKGAQSINVRHILVRSIEPCNQSCTGPLSLQIEGKKKVVNLTCLNSVKNTPKRKKLWPS